MMMFNASIPIDMVLKAYTNSAPSFSANKQLHFYSRIFRVTGNTKYLSPIKSLLHSTVGNKIKSINNIDNFSPSLINPVEDVRGTIRRNPNENKRIVRRESFYQHTPILKFYFQSLSDTSLFFDFHLHEGSHAKSIKEIIKKLKSINWRNEFVKKSYFLINPVYFINSIYRLNSLGLLNAKEKMDEFVFESFSPKKILSEENLYDQVYSYTHIIINESNFYQSFLSPETAKRYHWIFDFFENNFEKIYKKINLDLVLEILICFSLAKIKQPRKMRELAYKHLEKFYDQEHHYLKSDAQATIDDMEHANILLLIDQKMGNKLYQISKPLI